MHLAQAMRAPCIKQDALGGGRLTGVNMGHDADISHLFQGVTSRHKRWVSFRNALVLKGLAYQR
jgi:hypothetical protein